MGQGKSNRFISSIRGAALLASAALFCLLFASQAVAMGPPGLSLPLTHGVVTKASTLDTPTTDFNDEVIPNHYIVVLKGSVAHPANVASAQSKETGGEVGFVYRSALKGYSATMSKADVEALESDPRVKYVTQDRTLGIESQTTPTGVERIFAPTDPNLDIDATDDVRINANVAVIDTGIDYTHPDLNVVGRTNCVPAGENPEDPIEGEVEQCTDGAGTDGHGHGTHVAGTIGALDNGFGVVGVAPGARLWSVRVLNNAGSGSFAWILAGVDWVTATRKDANSENDIDVANVSIGCGGLPCKIPPLDEAFTKSAEAGVVYAVAAGNEGGNASESTFGTSPDVITVSALADYDGKPDAKGFPGICTSYGADDTLASFSNYGKDVEVAAPGVCIYSTYKNGGYTTISGTSMASPHVAGAAAILAGKNHPKSLKDVEAIRTAIVANSDQEWTDTSGDGTQEPLLDVGRIVTGVPTIGSETEATLHGRVRPAGQEAAYRFEYGTSTAYGTSIPAPDAKIGSGSNYVELSQTLKSLKGKTTYHYGITATIGGETLHGADRTFATTPPSATTDAASGIGIYHATLGGTVNPEGAATTYWFEYGTTESYGGKAPMSVKELAAGTSNVGVSATLEGLKGNKTYHFRIVAKNVAGTTTGADKTFTTAPAEWRTQNLPAPEESTGSTTTGVSCPQPDACVAVGDFYSVEASYKTNVTLAESWNGETWSPMSTPNPPGLEEGWKYNHWAMLRDVSCGSTTDCLAIGKYSNSGEIVEPLSQHWNGTKWEEVSVAKPSGATETRLIGVSCTSASSCEGVGYYINSSGTKVTLAERWNGTKWEIQSTPNPSGAKESTLSAVSCSSATECVGVGSYENSSGVTKTLAERWNGSAWAEQSIPSPGGASSARLTGISCPSSTACTAAGFSLGSQFLTLAERWNGTSWSEQSTPTPGEAGRLLDVSCTSASACTASGTYSNPDSEPLIERWNGSAWAVAETKPLALPAGWHQSGFPLGTSCVESFCVSVGQMSTWPEGGVVSSVAFAVQTAAPPSATTQTASGVTETKATLEGRIRLGDPEEQCSSEGGAECYFEYGGTTSYGQTAWVGIDFTGFGEYSPTITGLEPGTTYHFRIVAVDEGGASYGEDKTFTTAASKWTPKWTLQSTPNLNGNVYLSDVSCASASECIAVGNNKTQRWNGSEWSTMTDPNGYNLSDVSCPSTTYCLALPSGAGLGVHRWNGSEWSAVTAIVPAEAISVVFKGVSCTSSTFCMAVGDYFLPGSKGRTLAESWNGNAWTALTTPFEEGGSNTLNAVSCTSSTSCTAIGTKGGKAHALRWNGNEWSALAAPKEASNGSADISCTAASACTAVPGASAKVERWNGSEWSTATVPTPEGGGSPKLYGISCTSTSCAAVGSYTKESKTVTLAESWNGSAWSVQSTPNLEGGGEFAGVSCTSASKCTAAGYYKPKVGESKTLAARYGVAPQATTEAATSVKATEATLNGTINPEGLATSYYFEYGPTTSYGTKIPLSAKAIGSGAEGVKVSQTPIDLNPGTTYHYRVVATGEGGASYGEDKTFTTPVPKWTLQSTPNPSSNVYLKDVSCASATECIGVGSKQSSALAQRWNGSEWSTMTSPSGANLTDVSCPSTTYCLALPFSVGLGVQRWNGSEWSTVTAVVPAEAAAYMFKGVSCTSSTFCMAVGDYSLIGSTKSRTMAESWDGSKWTLLTTPFEEGGSNTLNAVSCTSSTSCTAIGTKGGKANALRWNGSEWSALAAPKEASIESADISCTAASACTAVPGASAKVERWNGSEWSSTTVPTPEGGSAPKLYGVSCATATSCAAVGSYTKESKAVTLAEIWNGTSWSVQSTPNLEGGGELAGVSCTSASKCTAAGYFKPKAGESKTLAARYD